METGALASMLATPACVCVCVCAEQEQHRAELLLQQQQAEEQLRRQREELQVSALQELQQVQKELARLQQDSKLKLLQAESEKQEVNNGCSCQAPPQPNSMFYLSGLQLVESQDFFFSLFKMLRATLFHSTQIYSAKMKK